MKKIMYVVCVIVSFFAFFKQQVSALETENLIDWEVITVNENKGVLEWSRLIPLTVGKNYTLVIGEDYCARYYEDMTHGIDRIIQISYVSGLKESLEFQVDTINRRAYIEFVAKESNAIFKGITISPRETSYEIMLYKGFYESFTYFYMGNQKAVTKGKIEVDIDTLDEIENLDWVLGYQNPNKPVEMAHVVSNTVEKKVGMYEVVYQAAYQGKVFYYQLSVHVVDRTSPVLEKDTIEVKLSTKKTLEEIIASLLVHDNTTHITRDHITVLEENYSMAKTPGDYTIKIEIEDDYHNKITETVHVKIIQDIVPKIIGPDYLFYYMTKGLPTLDVIKAVYSAVDYQDYDLEITIVKSDYTPDVTVQAQYKVVLGATDDLGVSSQKTIYISVIDDRQPTFIVSPLVVEVDTLEIETEKMVGLIEENLRLLGVEYDHISIQAIEKKDNLSKVATFTYEDKQGVLYTNTLTMIQKEKSSQLYVYVIGVMAGGVLVFISVRYYKKRKNRQITAEIK